MADRSARDRPADRPVDHVRTGPPLTKSSIPSDLSPVKALGSEFNVYLVMLAVYVLGENTVMYENISSTKTRETSIFCAKE